MRKKTRAKRASCWSEEKFGNPYRETFGPGATCSQLGDFPTSAQALMIPRPHNNSQACDAAAVGTAYYYFH